MNPAIDVARNMPAASNGASQKPEARSLQWTAMGHPLWRALLALAALANVVPLWSASHLPFTDLPQHAAAIATLRHFLDPAWKAQQYFTLALSQTQYLLYYLAGALLAVPFGTAERANLVLLSLIGLSFPYALRSLLRALHADERLALFGAPLFWSQTLLIGFFNYLAALPLTLWALALVVRQAESPARRRGWALAAVSLALFYLHLSAFLFFAPAAALAAWLLPRPETGAPRNPHGAQHDPRDGELALRALALRLLQLPNRLLWMLPSLAAALLFALTSPVVNPGTVGWTEPQKLAFEEPASALRNLPGALMDIWSGSLDEVYLLAILALLVLLSWPGRRAPEDPQQPWRRGVALAWVVLAAALYFFFPQSIGWLWQLNERYAIVIALLVPLLVRPAPGLRGGVPLLLAAAVALFAGGVARSHIVAFDREVGGFDELLARTQPGRRLIALIYDSQSQEAHFAPFLQYAGYYRARYGGMSSFSFAELPQSPLRYRPEQAPPAKPSGWEWRPNLYRNDVDGEYYDYVLVRGAPGLLAREQRGPRFHLIASDGAWQLWAKG